MTLSNYQPLEREEELEELLVVPPELLPELYDPEELDLEGELLSKDLDLVGASYDLVGVDSRVGLFSL